MVDRSSKTIPHVLLQTIAQEAITGVVAFDAKSEECVFLNRYAREALEVASEDQIFGGSSGPLKLVDLYSVQTHPLLTAFSRELLDGGGYIQNVQMRRANGQSMIANVSIHRVSVPEGPDQHLLIFEDITLQRKMQREIELKQEEIKNAFNEILDQNRQLKDLDQAKDRFIALTTHELRTPLSAIVATAEVLSLKLYESESQKEDFIKTIYEQGLQLMELVNDILDFAKIRAGKMEFCIEQLDLGPVLKKMVSGFEQMASRLDVSIEMVHHLGPAMAYFDELRLREVVNNVVNNAIKYNKNGGKVTITIAMPEVIAVQKRIRITVTDTGVGIPEAKVAQVFNEFETLGQVSKHHKGTGLGMPISKRLMQAMGGDLTLTSVEGEGTSFYIDLPTERVLAEEMYRSRADTWGDLAS